MAFKGSKSKKIGPVGYNVRLLAALGNAGTLKLIV